MEVVAGVRQKVSTYAQRTAASIDQKLTDQERPRVERSLAWAVQRSPESTSHCLSRLSCSSPAARPPVSAAAVTMGPTTHSHSQAAIVD